MQQIGVHNSWNHTTAVAVVGQQLSEEAINMKYITQLLRVVVELRQ